MVDMSFDDFEVDGKSYPLSYVSFEGDWESETDTAKRRAAFEAFSAKLKDYQHTTAKTYDMHFKLKKQHLIYVVTTRFSITYCSIKKSISRCMIVKLI